MNEFKICFIICTNNKLLLGECLEYIAHLYVPDNYEIDVLTISEAVSMTAGYNEGMQASDAKYKVYLHQDVFIFNRYFLYDMLRIFNDDTKIGMIGLVGYPNISNNGVMWHERRVGACPLYGVENAYEGNFDEYRYDIKEDGYFNVRLADGLLLATCVDISWDEEFDGWDFYDATQCIRFINAGYSVVVPKQTVPWFVHDDGKYLSVWNYNKYRKKFLNKYSSPLVDDKKIAFITCVNNEEYYKECLWYLRQLVVPRDFTIEFIPIRNAKSMVKGYNYGQFNSNAKYKVYIHQDVFITEKNFLIEMLEMFSKNSDIGMIGVLGTNNLYADAVMWDKWNYGRVIGFNGKETCDLTASIEKGERNDVKAIDGMLMATQYDIAWREDLDLGWDFYDVTQSIEYLLKNLRIGLLSAQKPLLIHDCGPSKLISYDDKRKIVLNEYSKIFNMKFSQMKYSDEARESEKNSNLALKLIADKKYTELGALLQNIFSNGRNWRNSSICIAGIFYEIYLEELKENKFTFLGSTLTWLEMVHKFNTVKFALRRIWYEASENNISYAREIIEQQECTNLAVNKLLAVSVPLEKMEMIASLLKVNEAE